MREWGLMSHTAILWRFHSLLNSVAFLGCPDREGAGQGWQTGLESHLYLNLDHDTPFKKKQKGFINQIRFSRRLSFGGKEDPSAKIKWEKQWFSLYCLSLRETWALEFVTRPRPSCLVPEPTPALGPSVPLCTFLLLDTQIFPAHPCALLPLREQSNFGFHWEYEKQTNKQIPN